MKILGIRYCSKQLYQLNAKPAPARPEGRTPHLQRLGGMALALELIPKRSVEKISDYEVRDFRLHLIRESGLAPDTKNEVR